MAQRAYAREFFKHSDTFEDTCPVCNLTYAREEPADHRLHRAFHRDVVDVFEPKTSITLAKLHKQHGQFVPVRWDSARAVRRRLVNISRVFRKEFGAGFTMYEENNDPGHGFLIAEPDGRAVGGFVVRWIEYSNAPACWTLCWVWVAPSHRRRGLMNAAWLMVKQNYEGIEPDPPFSKGAALSFAHRNDVSERIRKYAQGELASGDFD